MSERDNRVYLLDILESIEVIEQHLGEMTDYDFQKNLLVQDAVIRRFEIIGEASSLITADYKNTHQQIEWKLMKAMRNKLAHEYFGVSMITIFSTAKSELPLLKEKIQNLLKE